MTANKQQPLSKSNQPPNQSKSAKSFDELASQWGRPLVIDILDGLGYQAKDSYSADDPEFLAMQAVYNLMQREKLPIAHAIAKHQGQPIPEVSQTKQSENGAGSQNGKQSNPDGEADAVALGFQRTDAELFRQAAALEYVDTAKGFEYRRFTRQAIAEGRVPKDEELRKLHNVTEKAIQRYQAEDPFQFPFFAGGGRIPEQITIDVLMDFTPKSSDSTENTKSISPLESLFEPPTRQIAGAAAQPQLRAGAG